MMCFRLLAILFPRTERLVSNIKRNVLCWEACKPVFQKFFKEGGRTLLDILISPEIDAEVKKVLAMDNFVPEDTADDTEVNNDDEEIDT